MRILSAHPGMLVRVPLEWLSAMPGMRNVPLPDTNACAGMLPKQIILIRYDLRFGKCFGCHVVLPERRQGFALPLFSMKNRSSDPGRQF